MDVPEFIQSAGGSVVSRNILERRGHIKWLNREEPVNPVDNGWRVLSDVDTDEFLSDPDNMVIVDFNTLVAIEPALLGIYALPVGSDIQLVVENGRRRWYDNTTGQEIPMS